ncbi:MAG TPA: hypothetical protein VF649_03570 [Sphingomonas sp.]|jgi:hypothetical protein|uniref:hypothetical protein n=1 Tax=Sphingomonas sp. TaxID=28214 RepID=UPI002EDB4AEC
MPDRDISADTRPTDAPDTPGRLEQPVDLKRPSAAPAATGAGGNALSTGLQPSGTAPGGGPGTGAGSIGTGGGSTGDAATGNAASGRDG